MSIGDGINRLEQQSRDLMLALGAGSGPGRPLSAGRTFTAAVAPAPDAPGRNGIAVGGRFLLLPENSPFQAGELVHAEVLENDGQLFLKVSSSQPGASTLPSNLASILAELADGEQLAALRSALELLPIKLAATAAPDGASAQPSSLLLDRLVRAAAAPPEILADLLRLHLEPGSATLSPEESGLHTLLRELQPAIARVLEELSTVSARRSASPLEVVFANQGQVAASFRAQVGALGAEASRLLQAGESESSFGDLALVLQAVRSVVGEASSPAVADLLKSLEVLAKTLPEAPARELRGLLEESLATLVARFGTPALQSNAVLDALRGVPPALAAAPVRELKTELEAVLRKAVLEGSALRSTLPETIGELALRAERLRVTDPAATVAAALEELQELSDLLASGNLPPPKELGALLESALGKVEHTLRIIDQSWTPDRHPGVELTRGLLREVERALIRTLPLLRADDPAPESTLLRFLAPLGRAGARAVDGITQQFRELMGLQADALRGREQRVQELLDRVQSSNAIELLQQTVENLGRALSLAPVSSNQSEELTRQQAFVERARAALEELAGRIAPQPAADAQGTIAAEDVESGLRQLLKELRSLNRGPRIRELLFHSQEHSLPRSYSRLLTILELQISTVLNAPASASPGAAAERAPAAETASLALRDLGSVLDRVPKLLELAGAAQQYTEALSTLLEGLNRQLTQAARSGAAVAADEISRALVELELGLHVGEAAADAAHLPPAPIDRLPHRYRSAYGTVLAQLAAFLQTTESSAPDNARAGRRQAQETTGGSVSEAFVAFRREDELNELLSSLAQLKETLSQPADSLQKRLLDELTDFERKVAVYRRLGSDQGQLAQIVAETLKNIQSLLKAMLQQGASAGGDGTGRVTVELQRFAEQLEAFMKQYLETAGRPELLGSRSAPPRSRQAVLEERAAVDIERRQITLRLLQAPEPEASDQAARGFFELTRRIVAEIQSMKPEQRTAAGLRELIGRAALQLDETVAALPAATAQALAEQLSAVRELFDRALTAPPGPPRIDGGERLSATPAGRESTAVQQLAEVLRRVEAAIEKVPAADERLVGTVRQALKLVSASSSGDTLAAGLRELEQGVAAQLQRYSPLTAPAGPAGPYEEALKSLGNLLKGQEVLSQLNPVLQAIGEPMVLLFPSIVQGILSRLELIFYPVPQQRQSEDRPQRDGSHGQDTRQEADERGAEQQRFSKIRFTVELPSLGEVEVEFAHALEEALLSITCAEAHGLAAIEETLPEVEGCLRALGFAGVSCKARHAAVEQQRPDWLSGVIRHSVVV